MIVRKVTLSSAQILNLHITPVEIVPAPGVDVFLIPINIAGHLHYGTVTYAGGGDLYQYIGPTANGLSRPGLDQALMTAVADAMQVGNFPMAFLNIAPSNQFHNQPLNLFNIGAAFTLGDSTLDVFVAYEVFHM